MERARRAGVTAIVGILALAAVLAGPAVSARSPGVSVPTEPAAAVGWPPSTGLVVAEVVTGGASASDEWIEIANAGTVPLDLVGLELAYVTSSGATITRKATWAASLLLDPGRHLLLANASGIHAAVADVTYSGGLAATGGALVLRPVGGEPIDAVGWGDAINTFVEGAAAPAPPAGASIERRPGGALGHATDTNDNAADFLVNPLPVAQDLDSPPTPGASPTPSPSPTPTPTAAPSTDPSPVPSPSASADPSAEPSSSPSTEPTATPVPSPSPDPSASPTPVPSASPSVEPSPYPSVSADPSPSPSPSPSPTTADIAVVRALPDGASATIEGILTTALGALEGGRAGFIQDPSGGIALYLDVAAVEPAPAGTVVRVSGTVGERYGQQTLRIAWTDVVDLGPGLLPAPLARSTGTSGEDEEGRRVAISGEIVETPSELADGLGLSVDDGSGPIRVIVAPDAAEGLSLVRGARIEAVGPLGQRDSSGTGTSGYRLLSTLPGEVTLIADPWPSPDPSPDPSAPPSASPSPTSSPEPSPSPSPSASVSPVPSPSPPPTDPTVDTIAVARTRPLGSLVRVAGVVTAEPGRLGKPPLLAIEDWTAGVVVHLPDGAEPPERGDRIEVAGKLAAPYGQLEIRPDESGLQWLETSDLPTPLVVAASDLGEGLEARLVQLDATVVSAPKRATSGDLTVDVADAAGVAARLMVDASAEVPREAFATGARFTFMGIEGQRATRLGALDGYRIWLRDMSDLRPASSTPSATPGASPSAGPEGSEEPAFISIAGALAIPDVNVGIEATVTAGPALLDATGRRIVVQDPTGAVELLLPDARAIRVGDRIRAIGDVGTAYGAPRFRAASLSVVGRATPPAPADLAGSPDASMEWRLARVRGVVVDVRKMGDRWVAEIQSGGDRMPVSGLPGSGIEAGRLTEGVSATIVGIVRRPYPTATDRRFALVPRTPADIVTTRGAGTSRASTGAATSRTAGRAAGSGSAGGASSGVGATRAADGAGRGGPPSIDLGQLAEFRGRLVRVGGLVVEKSEDSVLLDDGTARAWLVLVSAAAPVLPDLAPGDAVSVTGTVSGEVGAERVVVDDPAQVVLAAGLVGASARPGSATPAGDRSTSISGGSMGVTDDRPVVDIARPMVVVLLGVAVIVALGAILRGRRWLERRRLATRIVARLASLAETAPGPEASPNVAPVAASVAAAGATLPVGRSGAS